MKQLIAGLVSVFFGVMSAQAALVMSFQESDGRVNGSMSGSLDLSGMTGAPGGSLSLTGLFSTLGWVGFGVPPADQTNFLGEISGPSTFGSGPFTLGASTGDAVFLAGNNALLSVPAGYVSGAALTGTLTFDDASFASLGVIPGDYVYTLASGDTLTLVFGDGVPPTPVPVPGTVPLLLAAWAALGVTRRWRL